MKMLDPNFWPHMFSSQKNRIECSAYRGPYLGGPPRQMVGEKPIWVDPCLRPRVYPCQPVVATNGVDERYDGACVAANDTRKAWASPCIFLSGSAAPWKNETCEPVKWWAKTAAKYPHIHVCASCTRPGIACASAPPPPPPPEGTCPVIQLE